MIEDNIPKRNFKMFQKRYKSFSVGEEYYYSRERAWNNDNISTSFLNSNLTNVKSINKENSFKKQFSFQKSFKKFNTFLSVTKEKISSTSRLVFKNRILEKFASRDNNQGEKIEQQNFETKKSYYQEYNKEPNVDHVIKSAIDNIGPENSPRNPYFDDLDPDLVNVINSALNLNLQPSLTQSIEPLSQPKPKPKVLSSEVEGNYQKYITNRFKNEPTTTQKTTSSSAKFIPKSVRYQAQPEFIPPQSSAHANQFENDLELNEVKTLMKSKIKQLFDETDIATSRMKIKTELETPYVIDNIESIEEQLRNKLNKIKSNSTYTDFNN